MLCKTRQIRCGVFGKVMEVGEQRHFLYAQNNRLSYKAKSLYNFIPWAEFNAFGKAQDFLARYAIRHKSYIYNNDKLPRYIGFNVFEPCADEIKPENYYKTV